MRAFLVVLALALVMPACAGSGSRGGVGRSSATTGAVADDAAPVTVGSTIVQAAAATAGLQARTSVSVTTTRKEPGTPVFALAGTGRIDLRTGAASLSVTVPSIADGPLAARVSRGRVLVRINGHWAPLAGEGAAQSDPSIPLALLSLASGPVRLAGRDDVRLVPTTHYRSAIDLRAALHRGDLPARVRATFARVAASVATPRIPLDVWLDGTGLARRIVLAFSLADGDTVRVQQDLYDFAA